MSHKQPKRQKCQPKKYTESEVNKMIRDATEKVAKHNVYTTVASCFLTLHRCFGFGKKRILLAYEHMNNITFDALSFEEVRQALLNETGIDVRELWEDQNG